MCLKFRGGVSTETRDMSPHGVLASRKSTLTMLNSALTRVDWPDCPLHQNKSPQSTLWGRSSSFFILQQTQRFLSLNTSFAISFWFFLEDDGNAIQLLSSIFPTIGPEYRQFGDTNPLITILRLPRQQAFYPSVRFPIKSHSSVSQSNSPPPQSNHVTTLLVPK